MFIYNAKLFLNRQLVFLNRFLTFDNWFTCQAKIKNVFKIYIKLI